MATIVDSLFLELGIDTSKFSADQVRALTKIQQFESSTKRAASGARKGIQTVGDAFRDLARESSVGASANRLDTLAQKFKALGQSAQASGGVGAALGGMSKGLGMLLSPASLGIAALGLLGKETLDFNASMTAMNATLSRNAELAGMSADKLWAMGQAAQTTGGNPGAVMAGIAGMQTALAGASIGVGNATGTMIMMARLAPYGARYNKGGFGSGANEESLFRAARNFYLANGRARTMALLTSGGVSPDQVNLAISPGGYAEYQKALKKAQAMKTGGGFDAVVRGSLKSQVGLGEVDINKAVAAETAYGGIQQPMQTMVGLLTNIYAVLSSMLGYVAQFVQFFTGGVKAAVNGEISAAQHISNALGTVGAFLTGAPLSASVRARMALGVRTAMNFGLSAAQAETMIGNMAAESGMDPLAVGPGGQVGLGQWDKSRQANFKRMLGYRMGSSAKSSDQQFMDQIMFAIREPQARAAFSAPASNLYDMVKNYQRLDEIVNDGSLGKRFSFAQAAARLTGLGSMLAAANSMTTNAAHYDNRSNAHFDTINITTAATNGRDFATDFRKGIMAQPLLSANAQQQAVLSTRGTVR